jgi:enamine deaminase RidA (YjgF/YER057c/UK114 family)
MKKLLIIILVFTCSSAHTKMMDNFVDQAIESLGYKLPSLPLAKSSFQPYVKSGKMLYISGQIPLGFGDIKDYQGKLGREFTIEQGQDIASKATMNILSQLKSAIQGDWNQVVKCVKLSVFVNSTEDFTAQPKIANAASDIMISVFGKDRGAHARSAIGVSQLPLGVAVEIEAIFELTH